MFASLRLAMTFEKGSTIMTNETRVAFNEGGRGLVLGLVLEDKDASEKKLNKTNSLSAHQSDSNSDSLTPEVRLAHLTATHPANPDPLYSNNLPPNSVPLIERRNPAGDLMAYNPPAIRTILVPYGTNTHPSPINPHTQRHNGEPTC